MVRRASKQQEVDLLIGECSLRAPTGIRNRALITILYRCGLGLRSPGHEALDLDIDKHMVRIVFGKGHKPRTVGIDDDALSVILRWIDTRRARGIKNGMLFCTLDGGQLSGSYVRDMLKRKAVKAGIDKRVHPHGLRHTHATELAHENVPINVISRQLGHSNSAVTARYIDHIAPADVIDMGRNRQWKH